MNAKRQGDNVPVGDIMPMKKIRRIVRCFKINEQVVSLQVGLPEFIKDHPQAKHPIRRLSALTKTCLVFVDEGLLKRFQSVKQDT